MKLLVQWYDQICMLKEPAMPDHAVEPKRLYRQVAGELRALINREGYAAGSRLPPERQPERQKGLVPVSHKNGALLPAEPPRRIELLTYSLRVNRSTD